jgi:hypothetical protein
MADDNIAEIIQEMSGKTSEKYERERQKAHKAAEKERVDEEVEAARRVAVATLDERDKRWREYNDANLGKMNSHQYREFVIVTYGFDPGV